MKQKYWVFALCCGILLLGIFVISSGCGTSTNSSAVSQSAGALQGDWAGVYTEEANGTQLNLKVSIVHKEGSKDFNGTVFINGDQYQVAGYLENNTIQMSFTNDLSTITSNGSHAAGRINGTFKRSTSGNAKMTGAAVTTSGTINIIKFIDIPASVQMGPWLLYSQDNSANQCNMTIRIGSKSSHNPTATVTATDALTGKTYGPSPMVKQGDHEYDSYDVYFVDILQGTISGLPSNKLFTYQIAIKDSKYGTTYVNASFRTPPSWADIQSGAVTSQIFFSYGDNRRNVLETADSLPVVEENIVNSAYSNLLATDPNTQTFIAHNGDGSTLGQNIEIAAGCVVGWKNEWLKSSNDTSDSKGHNLRYHTWLRASLPTFMSAGNHEGKASIAETGFKRGSFGLYGKLMAGIYNGSDSNVTLMDGSDAYDSFTYMTDYGGIRLIVLNTYNCYTSADAGTILAKIKTWINSAYPGGPIILLMHPSLYGSSTAEIGAYWSNVTKLRADLQPLINNKNNVIVISGHVHETARTVQQGVHYYVLGTGGAPDMSGSSDDLESMLNFSSGIKNPLANQFLDYAYGKFSVDYKTRKITADIIDAHTGSDQVVDTITWGY